METLCGSRRASALPYTGAFISIPGTTMPPSIKTFSGESMPKNDLTLYLGGTRSGKSACAEADVLRTGSPVLYVATAVAMPQDSIMAERIKRHRARRPASWHTLECPLDLAKHIAAQLPRLCAPPRCPAPAASSNGPRHDAAMPAILLDCVTLWIANIMFSLPDAGDLAALEASVRAEVHALLSLMEGSGCRWVLVSGEIGLGGIHPDNISRSYCDALGMANQLIAERAGHVYLVMAGRRLLLAE